MKGWYAFLKSERENVIASGIEGRANVLKEIARRWKIVKTAGTSTAPLLLTNSTEANDALILALRDLDEEEIDQAMDAHFLEKTGDKNAKIDRLVCAMMASLMDKWAGARRGGFPGALSRCDRSMKTKNF